MRLVIDAGTTKTSSAIVNITSLTSEIRQTSGINPVTDPGYDLKIHELLHPLKERPITEVFFYGSGCINETVNSKVKSAIVRYLPQAKIKVEDDLLGSCIASCGTNSGISVILGTGSNIGYFDGRQVVSRVNSCGYLLGDEGSGFKIGQAIYLRFCRGLMSKFQLENFERIFNISQKSAIHNLYASPNPRLRLATYSTFVKHLSAIDRDEILDEVFSALLTNLILPMYQKHNDKVHFVGSIGFHFQDQLKSILNKNDIIAGSFIKNPIEGLIKYHDYG